MNELFKLAAQEARQNAGIGNAYANQLAYANQATPRVTVETELEQLSKQVTDLQQLLGKLAETLTPICIPEKPVLDRGGPPEKEVAPSSNLVCRIRGIRGLLRSIYDAVDALQSRIEL